MQGSLVRLLVAATAATVVAASFAGAANAAKYIVVYNSEAVPADAASWIERSGGSLVATYPAIGVVIAQSSSPTFTQAMHGGTEIDTVAQSMAIAKVAGPEASPGDLPNSPATPDNLAPLQWDMRQIHAPEANAITGGSPAVIVGDIDTGLDKDHPDLVQNISFANSVSCESGAPNTNPAAWDDHNGHGTHTAGTIAAADNGFGVTGVAPNVKVAGIKASNDDGFFFPEMVVCAFMWAGSHHLDVTNNSYFADPFYFNCRNDAEQRAIWKAESRAIRFAQTQGVTVVSAAGNFSDDLAHPTQDVISPDFPEGTEEKRTVHNNCVVIPVEIPGVIGVSATGVFRLKSYYSNYGVSAIDVAAPGGDRILQVSPADGAVNGRVLSTWPSEIPCTRKETDGAAVYCYLQGTSMASLDVAGLAALVISRFGDAKSRQNGKMRPGEVAAIIQRTADPTTCPDDLTPYAPFPSVANGAPQTCQGGTGNNGWYGSGIINALSAVTHGH